ncbi:DNA-binding protein [Spirochaetia bacterium]|nr:DNA-binding protein [Spirochaetia bacterium]
MAENMTDRESAQEWQNFAKMDLDSAEFLLKMKPVPTEIICFHCQQSVEKSLKSILILNAVFPPRRHDLLELRELCLPFITDADSIDKALEHLNKYSVRPRYPKEIEITDAQLRQAVVDARVLFEYSQRFFVSAETAGE